MLPFADCVNEVCGEEQIEPWLEIAIYCVLGLCALAIVAMIVWCVVEMWKGDL